MAPTFYWHACYDDWFYSINELTALVRDQADRKSSFGWSGPKKIQSPVRTEKYMRIEALNEMESCQTSEVDSTTRHGRYDNKARTPIERASTPATSSSEPDSTSNYTLTSSKRARSPSSSDSEPCKSSSAGKS